MTDPDGSPTSRWLDTDAPRGDDYDARWAALAASGVDPHGEVAFVQRYRPASVLDAGCGTGRVARELVRRGVPTIGADIDPRMLDTARSKAPEIEWHLTDLAALDLRDTSGGRRTFDVVVAAGNVMIFLGPGTEPTVMARLADHIGPGGRLIAGFQLDRTVTLADYDAWASAVGLELEDRFATWDGEAFEPPGTYAVSVHRGPG